MPMVNAFDAIADYLEQSYQEHYEPCPNCGIARQVERYIMKKCPNCGDDEIDLTITPDVP